MNARITGEALSTLEAALDEELLEKMREQSTQTGGAQYRSRTIEFPTRASILKLLTEEEKARAVPNDSRSLSDRAGQGANINRGLDLEIRRYVQDKCCPLNVSDLEKG